jgi:hypothetical protein
MKKKKVFLIFIFFFFILQVNAMGKKKAPEGDNRFKNSDRIAVFPFSDHSFKTIASVEKINKSADILKNLHEILESKNIGVVQKDFTERLLLAENIIRSFDFQKNPASYQWNMINSSFAKTTNETVIEYIINRYNDTVVLSKTKAVSIAKDLDADFLIRGIILNKTPKSFLEKDKILKQSEGFISKRILPIFLRGKFCYASTSSYESGLPSFSLRRPTSFSPFFKLNKNIIEVFIFIQDGKTGDIVWSTDFKVKYFSKDYYLATGFNNKVKKEINSAMQNLFPIVTE